MSDDENEPFIESDKDDRENQPPDVHRHLENDTRSFPYHCLNKMVRVVKTKITQIQQNIVLNEEKRENVLTKTVSYKKGFVLLKKFSTF